MLTWLPFATFPIGFPQIKSVGKPAGGHELHLQIAPIPIAFSPEESSFGIQDPNINSPAYTPACTPHCRHTCLQHSVLYPTAATPCLTTLVLHHNSHWPACNLPGTHNFLPVSTLTGKPTGSHEEVFA